MSPNALARHNVIPYIFRVDHIVSDKGNQRDVYTTSSLMSITTFHFTRHTSEELYSRPSDIKVKTDDILAYMQEAG